MIKKTTRRRAAAKRPSRKQRTITTKILDAFADAWNRHDVDRLMSFMAQDCVFDASAGTEVCGTRYKGRDQVRKGFSEVFAAFSDAHWAGARQAPG